MLPHPSPGSGLVANSPLNPMHVPSPAGLMPTSSPGPCSNVQVGHSPAGSFMQTGMSDRRNKCFHLYTLDLFSVLTLVALVQKVYTQAFSDFEMISVTVFYSV